MGIGTLKVSHHKFTEPHENTEMMDDHFQSVFTDEDSGNLNPLPYSLLAICLQ